MTKNEKFDVVIIGAGLAGLTAANALCKPGLSIALVAPKTDFADGRSTALLANTVDYLKELGIWENALPKAAPMSVMRLIDNTRRLLHAPETSFKSMEIGLDVFGYNILNSELSKALITSFDGLDNIQRIDDKITGIRESDDVEIELESGKNITCKLVVGADGRGSIVRQCAEGGKGIATRQWQYPQTAIVLNFKHTLPHGDASTEFHNISGPFTTVPLGNGLSSLVWVVKPEDASGILEMERSALEREIETRMHSILGKVKVVSEVQSFPLGGMSALKMAAGRVFLVGDAAHGFPPIGAQGYNLGIRDISQLAALLQRGLDDPVALANSYNAKRKNDVFTRTLSVDLFNRSLLSDFLPVQLLRSGGIRALSGIGPLRKMAMREGVSPGLGVREFGKALRGIAESIRPGAR